MSDRSTYIAIDNNAPYPNTVNASNPLPVTIPTGTTIDIVASTPLDVVSPGHVCTDNSTDTPLGIGEVFQGLYQDTLNFSEIIISVSSDKNSATDGLVVEWSADGITINETDEFSILANRGKTFSFPCNRRYLRVKYTNGTAAQTTFNLATYFKRFASKGSSHRIKDAIVGDDDAVLTKSVLTGQNPAGNFVNFQSTTKGNFKVSLEEFDATLNTTPLPVIDNASTDSDDKLNLIIRLLLQKSNEAPVWLDVINNALRTTNVTSQAVTITSGTVTAVTTVGTLTNQTNIGGYSADLMTVNASETDWGITTRMLLI